jgi:hypothetical protein
MPEANTQYQGYDVCWVEGCDKTPRLSGYCPKHDCEALAAMMDAPSFNSLPILARCKEVEVAIHYNTVQVVRDALKIMNPEQRLELFNDYCTSCGGTEHPCYCMRDE